MQITVFKYSAKFGHFLRAEASTSAPSYPVPPRTALFGLAGAVLGLEKDTAPVVLEHAQFALAGKLTTTHWHTAKFRKDPPALLPRQVKAGQIGTTKPEKATMIPQEWLLRPQFVVYAALPPPYDESFDKRVRERRWYFSPCMGLSEMIADLRWLGSFNAEALPEGFYRVQSVVRQDNARLEAKTVFQEKINIRQLRLPREVTPERVFRQAQYWVERDGQAIPVNTSSAWRVEDQVIMFL